MAPPTATETATASIARLSISEDSSAQGPGTGKLRSTAPGETSEELLHKYVFYHDNPKAFDIQKAKEQHEGPSPYAHSRAEGPSVLKEWAPQKASGKLDSTYKYIEVTPPLGRQYIGARLKDILADDELLHDLAIVVAERGVVFFRDQHDLTVEEQKQLALRLGSHAGKPESSGLHIHPTALAGGLLDKDGQAIDPEVTLLNSRLRKSLYKDEGTDPGRGARGSDTVFHSDVTFEPVPALFSTLRLIETPSATEPREEELERPGGGPVGGSGGDTIWASGYALAEKISPSFLAYLETLTGEFYQPLFKSATDHQNVPFFSGKRGAPENTGTVTTATHPLIRTNPTTGWKSLYGTGSHFYKVNGVSAQESDFIKHYFEDLLYKSPELQLRFKWNRGDIGIWDNRSTFHSAILDIDNPDGQVQNRTGLRTVVTGERPFFDPKRSSLRKDAILAEWEAKKKSARN